MSILLDRKTRVLVQGIKGGEKMDSVPVFNSVLEAVHETGAEASVFFVPASFVVDAFFETVEAGIRLIVVVPEHIPVHDVMKMRAHARKKGVIALGPTTPGIITPGQAKMGIMPAVLFSEGRIGIVSRSGSLAFEMAGILGEADIGQSTVVGIGADSVVLTNIPEILKLFEKDDCTDAVVIIGEVGGMQEEKSAEYIAKHMTKPVASYIAGRFSPEGKRMGHAGAIIRGEKGTFESKCQALRDSGVEILDTPRDAVSWAQKHDLR